MTRWLLRTAAVAIGATPVATAQPPSRPDTVLRTAQPEDVVLLMRTTGQADRKLKVVKRSAYDDGESLVDVQDVATGQTFTLPAKLADRLPRVGAAPVPPGQPAPVRPLPAVAVNSAPVAPVSPPAVAPRPAGPPATVWSPIAPDPTPARQLTASGLVPIPSATTGPSAAPAPAPVLLPSPTSPARSPDRWKPIPAPTPFPLTPSPTPTPSDSDDAITVRGQMPSALGGRPTAFRPTGDAPLKPPPPTDAMGALPPTPDKSLPTAFPKLIVPASPAVAAPHSVSHPVMTRPPATRPQPTNAVAPSLPVPQPANGMVSSFPTPAAQPTPPVWRPIRDGVGVTPPFNASKPTPPDVEAPAVPAFAPAASPPVNPGSARITTPAVEAPQTVGERPSSWTPEPPQVSLERKGPEVELRRAVLVEIRSLETTLAAAARPSERVAAASNLAESRYAARPEVRAVLARAAMTDPSLTVRVECIRALSQLGHTDPDYVAYLRASTSGSTEENLRLAATEALRQVGPKE